MKKTLHEMGALYGIIGWVGRGVVAKAVGETRFSSQFSFVGWVHRAVQRF